MGTPLMVVCCRSMVFMKAASAILPPDEQRQARRPAPGASTVTFALLGLASSLKGTAFGAILTPGPSIAPNAVPLSELASPNRAKVTVEAPGAGLRACLCSSGGKIALAAFMKTIERQHTTISGVPIEPGYGSEDRGPEDSPRLPAAGEFPYPRGIHRDMYRAKLWTMRQFSGFATPEETNRRYHYLLEQGQTGLSVAFDLPTLMGYDSDHPMADGETGRCGAP